MSLVLPDGTYSLFRPILTEDDSAFDVATYPPEPDWAGPGHISPNKDRSFRIRLDPSCGDVPNRSQILCPSGVRVDVIGDGSRFPATYQAAFERVSHVSLPLCWPLDLGPYPGQSQAE